MNKRKSSDIAENSNENRTCIYLKTFNNVNENKKPRIEYEVNDINNNDYNYKAGHIQSIRLINFKCHSFLEFNFSRYVNFLSGSNASGKSSIMDAVILCLGGKSISTGREANAALFIKHNTNKAEIRITLSNQGEDAIKPCLYGSQIVIERKISKNGSSQYRLFNEKNKLLTTKKKEIDEVIRALNIQIENPICFLNQEESKRFLYSTNSADKYQMFMKASQLETMQNMIELIDKERYNSKSIIERKKVELSALENKLYQWEQKYKQCKVIENLKKALTLRIKEYSWSVVSLIEKEIEELKSEKCNAIKFKEKEMMKMETDKNSFMQIKAKSKDLVQRVNDFEKEILRVKANKAEALLKSKQAQVELKSIVNEMNQVEESIIKGEKLKHEISKAYEKETNNLRVINENDRIENMSQITKIEQLLETLRLANEQRSQEILEAKCLNENDFNLYREKLFGLKSFENLIVKTRSEIEKINRSSRDKMLCFGLYVPSLIRDVKNHYEKKRFKRMPIGPIGNFLQSKSSEWSLAIEQCLTTKILCSFICDNQEDGKLMQRLISIHAISISVSKRPNVYVSDFNTPLYDFKKFRPEISGYSTVMEMLMIENSVVANTLMDHRHIESILLLPKFEIALELFQNNGAKNCNEAYLINGDHVIHHATIRIYSSKKKLTYYLNENFNELARLKNNELEKTLQQYENMKLESKSLNEKIKINKNKILKIEQDIDSSRREELLLKNRLLDIKNLLNIMNQSNILNSFQEEILNIEETNKKLEAKLNILKFNESIVKERLEKIETEIEIYENDLKNLTTKIQDLYQELNDLNQQKNSLKKATIGYRKMLNEKFKQEADIDKQINEKQINLEKHIRKAEELCGRIQTTKTPKRIEAEIKAYDKQINAIESLNGNEINIAKIYLNKTKQLKQAISCLNKQTLFLAKLDRAYLDRMNSSNLFKESKALSCIMSFNRILSKTDFTGKLKFDHDMQTLDINIRPKFEDNFIKEQPNLLRLSGGERSFSTIAFILSLWSVSESPILFLDEFDVYMDQINRNMSIKLILESAKTNLNSQCIFITPQSGI